MTKTAKTVIFLISMRIQANWIKGQLLLALCLLFFACTGRKDEAPVTPPVTSPLSRNYIGYGVITVSFTHVAAEPSENSPSIGYLRRGTMVHVLRRQPARENGFSSWVFVEGSFRGWLKEDVMIIYSNESQARTASESMTR